MDASTEPDIDYPCRWAYKIVGPSEPELRGAVAEIVGAREHSVTVSRVSRTGRYVSVQADVVVGDHVERRALARAFHEHEAVVFVL